MLSSFKSGVLQYATFDRRTSRKGFWLFLLALALIQSLSLNIASWMAGKVSFKLAFALQLHTQADWTTNTFTALVIIPFMAALMRRFNDAGFQVGRFLALGLALFATFILFVKAVPTFGHFLYVIGAFGPIYLGYFLFVTTRPSQPGINKFGPNPHEVSS